MFYMKNQLGALQIGDNEKNGRVSFKLFFPGGFDPEILTIKVAGDFQHLMPGARDWDFQGGLPLVRDDSSSEGTFWKHETSFTLPADFYQYKYMVEYHDGSTRIVSDPCTRYGGREHQNGAFVIGGSRPVDNMVRPLRSGRKHLKDLILYEMNLDDFTDEYRETRAPFRAVLDKLDYLAGLGFNAILLMPWTSWKDRNFDWGYQPFQYFAVEYRYANDMEDPSEKISWLKQMISACHDRGIHVLMDGVFNHVSMDFPYKWFYRDPEACPFTGDFGGTFPGLQDLDFNNSCTRIFIRDVCLYWIETFKIDGIRFDNTVNFYIPGETKGLSQLLNDIQNELDNRGEANFCLTIEHIRMDAPQLTNNTAATSYWDNALYERCFQYLWERQIDTRLLNALNNNRHLNSSEKVPTIYLSNHDHSHVTWQAGARNNSGGMAWYKIQPYIIALYTATAVPMVPNGQEFGADHWIPENDDGTGRRVIPRPLQWKCADDKIGIRLRKLHKRMAEIRKTSIVLRSGEFKPFYWEEWQTRLNPIGLGVDTERQIAVYRRSGIDESGKRRCFLIVLNFSDSMQPVSVRFPESGIWTDLLSGYAGDWRPLVQNNRLDFIVGSNWGHVFFQ